MQTEINKHSTSDLQLLSSVWEKIACEQHSASTNSVLETAYIRASECLEITNGMSSTLLSSFMMHNRRRLTNYATRKINPSYQWTAVTAHARPKRGKDRAPLTSWVEHRPKHWAVQVVLCVNKGAQIPPKAHCVFRPQDEVLYPIACSLSSLSPNFTLFSTTLSPKP